jgi:hypothetical protein
MVDFGRAGLAARSSMWYYSTIGNGVAIVRPKILRRGTRLWFSCDFDCCGSRHAAFYDDSLHRCGTRAWLEVAAQSINCTKVTCGLIACAVLEAKRFSRGALSLTIEFKNCDLRLRCCCPVAINGLRMV